MLAILQLDFLHGSDELVGLIVVDGLLLKQFIIEHLSSLQEQGHPCTIEDASQQEDGKYQLVVEEQHHREYHEGKHGKGDVERLLRKEVVHTTMVVHSLHQVAHEFRVKERHRQLQELDKEVAYQRDIDTQGYVKQQPPADKVDSRSADGKHQLSQQNEPDKTDVVVLDTDIHDGLGKERQDKLQEATDNQAQDDLPEVLAVFLHIPKEKAERPLLFDILFALHLIGKESRRCFQEHGDALILAIGVCAYPMLFELIQTISHQSLSWVSHIELLVFLYLIQDYKVILVPMENTR